MEEKEHPSPILLDNRFSKLLHWNGVEPVVHAIHRAEHSSLQLFFEQDLDVRNYGFRLKNEFPAEQRLAIRDLWAWLKRLLDSHEKKSEELGVLKNIRDSVARICTSARKQINGYEVCDVNNELFRSLFGRVLEKNKDSRDKQLDSREKNDFVRHIFLYTTSFQTAEAIAKIDGYVDHLKKAEGDQAKKPEHDHSKKSEKELRYIRKLLWITTQPQLRAEENRALWNECIYSEELDDPYLKLIQLFLSKRYLAHPSEAMRSTGVYMLDRLYFVVKFLTGQAVELVSEFALSASGLDVVPLVAHDPKQVADLLQEYLDETHDILTVGLASECLLHLFGFTQLEKFSAALRALWNQYYLITVSQVVGRQLSRAEKGVPSIGKAEDTEFQHFCFYCQNTATGSKTMFDETARNTYFMSEYNRKFCPKCFKKWSSCSICMATLELIPEPNKSKKVEEKSHAWQNRNFALWCFNCGHGGHYEHIREWFMTNDVCVVPGCTCQCCLL